MDSFVASVWSGVIAGVIASAMSFILLRRLQPDLVISPVIAREAHEDGSAIYRVKVVNRGRRTVADVKCEMYLLRKRNVQGGQVNSRTRVPLRTSELNQLRGHRRKSKDFDNVFRFGTDFDLRGKWKVNDGYHVVFRVFAQDAVSRVGKTFEQAYHSASDLKDGVFRLGEGFEVAS